jgi:ribonucleotide reductase beta subunit family protein with ferritin-like domain
MSLETTLKLEALEPLLMEENRRFTLYPIQNKKLWDLYQTQLACMWKASEIDCSKDLEDFQTLNKDEQFYIKRILGFFSSADGLINFNLGKRFLNDVKIMEGLVCYSFQMMMENIHSEMYSIMLDNLVKDPQERSDLLNAIKTIDSVNTLSKWAFKWSESNLSFAHRVVAFCVFEAVLFSGAFASIFWLKKFKSQGKNFLQGLILSNNFISRDENLHVQAGVTFYNMLEHTRLTEQDVYSIVDEGLEVAKFFMTDALPVRLIGMNSESMCKYLEYISDKLLVDLGYNKKYNTPNPYQFMETIGLSSSSNFFELRANEYGAAYTANNRKGKLEFLEDF